MKRLFFLIVAGCFVFLTTPVHATEPQQVAVHYLNVGQADCIIIQAAEKNMLIDSGNNAHARKVLAYLKRQGVEAIDMLVATHPHHDHIGAMDELLNTFPVHTLYMPSISHRTRFYRALKKAANENNTTVIEAKAPQTIRLVPNIRIDVLAPLGKRYVYKNNYSLVLKMTHGKNRFLFMADAGWKSQGEMLKKKINVKADVIKIAHHGAISGMVGEFLDRADPKYAIISAGGHKKFGFPSHKVIKKLKKKNVTILRTDRQGTIIAASDGKSIRFHTEHEPGP